MDEKDFELVSPERRKQIQEEARKQVLAERRKEAEKLLLNREMEKFKAEGKPELEKRGIFIDLPGHALNIKLDGRVFEHGHSYEVDKNVYDTLKDLVARAWEHENEVGMANHSLYQRPQQQGSRGYGLSASNPTGVKF